MTIGSSNSTKRLTAVR